MDSSTDIIFSSQNLRDQYLKIIDSKIERYDDDLNEVSEVDSELYTPELMEELINFCQKNDNFLDTVESILYKTANSLETSVHLLTFEEKSNNFIFIFSSVNALDFNSLTELRKEYLRINPFLSFEEFLEGLVWESQNPDRVLRHYEKYIYKGENFKEKISDDYRQEFWDDKVKKWIEEDRNILQLIYKRQLDLLMYSVYPDIKRNYIRNSFQTKSRELSFSVIDNENSMTASVYDKFIFCNPTEEVPFIKILLTNSKADDVYKVYTQVQRSAINEWISRDEKLEEDSPFENEDYIFFLIKITNKDQEAQLIPLYAECYLSENKLSVKVPSSLNTEAIQKIIENVTRNLFNIDIFDMKELSVKIETIIDNFPHIQLVYLQFYLATNDESSIYMKETDTIASSKTRKIRMYYKPLSEINTEKYIIEYEDSNTKKLIITGPTHDLSINFFVNIFGRTIKAFFLRQNAIKIMFHRVILGEDFLNEKQEEKKSKKKKKSSTIDPHLITKKDKINLLKSIIPLPDKYSEYCQCKRQPTILTDEEAEAFLQTGETIFDKNNQFNVQKSVKTFVLEDGRRINFACHSVEHPDIYLTKESRDGEELFELSPCCWNKKRKESVELDKIILAKNDETNIEIKEKKNEIYSAENLDEVDEPIYLPQELDQLLSFLSGEENFNILHPSKKVSTSSFLECILIALKEKQINIKEYREVIKNNTNPLVLAQEALGIDQSPENVHEDIANISKILDSKLHYRAFEEYFKINIFVFELGNDEINNSIIENDFELEIPYHKIFSARTLRRERPTIILIRYRNSPEYALIVNSKNRGKFKGDLTVKIMELFLNCHEVSSQVSYSQTKNIFSRINWDSFFKGDTIQAQEIDISGKARVVQLKSGLTIAIPPTQPFDVPLITKYTETPVEKVKSIFGEPNSWDDKGLWYSVMKIPNLIYVLTGFNTLDLPKERNLDSVNLPLNPFVPKEDKRQDLEFIRIRSLKRATFALIQIIHWAWRLDKRPNFKNWIANYMNTIRTPRDYNDIYNFIPEYIYTTFPKTITVKEGFQEINRWWPEMFTSNGKINLWNTLYDKIIDFFERESLVLSSKDGKYIDPPQKHLIGFYDFPDDYPSNLNVRIFISKESFKTWSRIDRKREENPKLSILTIDSKETISTLISKEVPTRVLFKDHWITIYNLKENSYEMAVKFSYNWLKNKSLNLDENMPNIPSNYEVIVLSFSKKYEIIITDVIKSDKTKDPKRLYVLRYPDNTYASVLLN